MTDPIAKAEVAVIIEDDPDVRSLLSEVFSAAGFVTVEAASGLAGVAEVERHNPVITTLDVNLPSIDGLEVARRIRKFSDTHIIMISALADESDFVLGLGAGADDYLVKPFRPRELRARIEAVMRRPRPGGRPVEASVHPLSPHGLPPYPAPPLAPANYAHPAEPAVPAPAPPAEVTPEAPARNPSTGISMPIPAMAGDEGVWQTHRDISLNLATGTVLVAQQEVDLSHTEFVLLATLFESRRRVRSKADLALVVRGDVNATSFYVGEADKRAIEAHMTSLRRKIGDSLLEPRYVEGVRGVGYRLTPSDPGEVSVSA